MSSGSSPLTCVVVNWNGADRILKCLDSIRVSSNVSAAVVVVDNGSRDYSLDQIRKQVPTAVILQNDSNEGFTKATNQGIAYALEHGAEFILLLNSDAYLSKDCLSKLHQVAEANPNAGIVSPRICDARREDVIWYDGGIVNRWGDTVHRNMGRSAPRLNERNKETVLSVDFATGCCMVVRSKAIASIGLLDERYFAYSEDADFSFRCRDAGFDILHDESAIAWHYQSDATKKNRGKWFRDYYVTRNRFFLMRKRLQGLKWLTFLLYALLRHILVPIIYHAAAGEGKRCTAILRGVQDFVLNKSGKVYA